MSSAHPAPAVISETAPSGARLLQFRGGDSIQSTASSIAFLWSNWDVLFRISKGSFHAEKKANGIWHGGGYGGSGEWYLAPPFIGVNEGRFEFYSSLRFLGSAVRGKSIFEYRRVTPQTFYYSGRSWGELPPRLGMLRWFVETLGNIATAKFNSIGGGAAEMISRQPSLVQPHCDADTYKAFLEMIDEENEICSGRKLAAFRFFKPSIQNDIMTDNDPLGDLQRDLNKLERKLRASSRHADLIEYQRCLDLFLTDPDSAVIKARKILEPIVLRIFQSEFPEHSGKLILRGQPKDLTLNDRIKELTYQSKNVPNGITALMHSVNGMGNVGAHFATGKVPNVIDLAQFKTSFSASLGIADWFYNSPFAGGKTDAAAQRQPSAPDN